MPNESEEDSTVPRTRRPRKAKKAAMVILSDDSDAFIVSDASPPRPKKKTKLEARKESEEAMVITSGDDDDDDDDDKGNKDKSKGKGKGKSGESSLPLYRETQTLARKSDYTSTATPDMDVLKQLSLLRFEDYRDVADYTDQRRIKHNKDVLEILRAYTQALELLPNAMRPTRQQDNDALVSTVAMKLQTTALLCGALVERLCLDPVEQMLETTGELPYHLLHAHESAAAQIIQRRWTLVPHPDDSDQTTLAFDSLPNAIQFATAPTAATAALSMPPPKTTRAPTLATTTKPSQISTPRRQQDRMTPAPTPDRPAVASSSSADFSKRMPALSGTNISNAKASSSSVTLDVDESTTADATGGDGLDWRQMLGTRF